MHARAARDPKWGDSAASGPPPYPEHARSRTTTPPLTTDAKRWADPGDATDSRPSPYAGAGGFRAFRGVSEVPGRLDPVGSKHQDYRDAVEWLKDRGWRVDETRKGYPRAYCPCGKHMRSVHLTPSGPGYWRNLRSVGRTDRTERLRDGGVMDTYSTRLVLEVTGPDPAGHVELVLDAYYDLEVADPALLDCAFGFSAKGDGVGVVEVEQTVTGDDPGSAFRYAAAAVRTAIHAAGGSTPSWDEPPTDGVEYVFTDAGAPEPVCV